LESKSGVFRAFLAPSAALRLKAEKLLDVSSAALRLMGEKLLDFGSISKTAATFLLLLFLITRYTTPNKIMEESA
jgi:hypothetical protein